MESIISKQEFDELISLKGEVRGISLKADADFIIKERSERDLKRIEEIFSSLGHKLDYSQIRPMAFYPIGLKGIILLLMQRIFDFKEDDFVEMGKFGSKIPVIVRLFMQHFGSLDMVVKGASRMWGKYYSVGETEVTHLDKDNKKLTLQVRDFLILPIHCQVLRGYFMHLLQMIVGGKVECRETKCPFRGDDFHEFFLTWE
jgi:hypothetical protein